MMNDSYDLLLDNVLEESPTGSLLEGPGGLEALFEGGDDVSYAFLQHSTKHIFFVGLSNESL